MRLHGAELALVHLDVGLFDAGDLVGRSDDLARARSLAAPGRVLIAGRSLGGPNFVRRVVLLVTFARG